MQPINPRSLTFQTLHLLQEGQALWADPAVQSRGWGARPLVNDSRLTMRLLALKAGAEIPEHAAPGSISVHVLTGRISFTAGGQPTEAGPGDAVTVPQEVRHARSGLEDSLVLVTVGAPNP
ncbi:MAG TPA: cupin domain-containing protein [Deinococcales bacterium]|nr:cupin domain-containing protein [Deinococcales bacterium]